MTRRREGSRLWRYVLKRCLWMLPTLLGISFVTFLMMDLAPGDRASSTLGSEAGALGGEAVPSAAALRRLRIHYGQLDPVTGEPRPFLVRYGEWLEHVATLRLVGPHEDVEHFEHRIAQALPVTLLLNVLALAVALGIAMPLGAWLGMHHGSRADHALSGVLFLLWGVPEFLIATLLLLCLGGGLFPELLPAGGLHSAAAVAWSPLRRAFDLGAHLVLPVLTLAIGPCVVVTRFLRDSVARALHSDFVLALRGWGLPETTVRRRALRNGLAPLVTLIGGLLPMLIGGSVIVEWVFSLPGMGDLAYLAVRSRDHAMVMTLTLMVSMVTLIGLLLSDVLQRVVDPRVELQ